MQDDDQGGEPQAEKDAAIAYIEEHAPYTPNQKIKRVRSKKDILDDPRVIEIDNIGEQDFIEVHPGWGDGSRIYIGPNEYSPSESVSVRDAIAEINALSWQPELAEEGDMERAASSLGWKPESQPAQDEPQAGGGDWRAEALDRAVARGADPDDYQEVIDDATSELDYAQRMKQSAMAWLEGETDPGKIKELKAEIAEADATIKQHGTEDEPQGQSTRCETGTHRDPKTNQCKPIR